VRAWLGGLLLVALLSTPARAGDIVGTVTIQSSLAAPAVGKKVLADSDSAYGGYGDDEPVGVRRLSKGSEAQFVVVYVAGANLKATPAEATMRQKDKTFVPHVLPVVKGSTVAFTNNDQILHNVYTVTPPGFDIPKYGKGKVEKRVLRTAGPVELFCGIHNRMNAYVFVVENDYFAMPDANRKFKISGLPAGTYTLKAWHPRTGAFSKQVTVPASGGAQVDVTL